MEHQKFLEIDKASRRMVNKYKLRQPSFFGYIICLVFLLIIIVQAIQNIKNAYLPLLNLTNNPQFLKNIQNNLTNNSTYLVHFIATQKSLHLQYLEIIAFFGIFIFGAMLYYSINLFYDFYKKDMPRKEAIKELKAKGFTDKEIKEYEDEF